MTTAQLRFITPYVSLSPAPCPSPAFCSPIFRIARISDSLFLDILQLIGLRQTRPLQLSIIPSMEHSDTNKQACREVVELNAAISVLLDSGDLEPANSAQALQNVFDLLLWAEKRDAGVLQSVLQSELLLLLLDRYGGRLESLLSGMILLLGNAKEDGLLAGHILQRRLGDKIIRMYLEWLSRHEQVEEDEHLQVLGSLLKAYHRHFTQQNLPRFIDGDRCLLIDICCKFFNCPEEITRTSVMNILMSILKAPFVEEVMAVASARRRIGGWCQDMCRLLRNELKDFDQHLLITDHEESEFIIHSINDKVILWEDLSALNPRIFAPHFYAEIVLPLVVGSLNTNGIPLFTLKFALFVINKLVPTIAKLGLLPVFGSLLFEEKDILYHDQQLGTAVLRPFSLKKLLREEASTYEEEVEQPNVFKQLNQFFMNILRTKDGRFLQCVCVLLVNLLSAVKTSQTAIEYFIRKLGFGPGGKTIGLISQVMVTHFTAVHTLEITRIISALLIYIQPSKFIQQSAKNRLIHVYRGVVDQAMQTIEKQRDVHPYLAQTLEYDIKILSSPEFALEPVVKTDAALLFNNHIIQNESLPFYQQLPETAVSIARYQIVKALLMRNLSKKLIEECAGDLSAQRYLDRLRVNEARYIKPGQNLRLPISVNSYRCKLQDSKITIPTCLILDDDQNLIVGFLENSVIRIISNFKYKHVYTEVKNKKEKLYVGISTFRFNTKTQNVEEVKEYVLKHLEVGEDYFRVKKARAIAQELGAIMEILKMAKKCIPEFSLL